MPNYLGLQAVFNSATRGAADAIGIYQNQLNIQEQQKFQRDQLRSLDNYRAEVNRQADERIQLDRDKFKLLDQQHAFEMKKYREEESRKTIGDLLGNAQANAMAAGYNSIEEHAKAEPKAVIPIISAFLMHANAPKLGAYYPHDIKENPDGSVNLSYRDVNGNVFNLGQGNGRFDIGDSIRQLRVMGFQMGWPDVLALAKMKVTPDGKFLDEKNRPLSTEQQQILKEMDQKIREDLGMSVQEFVKLPDVRDQLLNLSPSQEKLKQGYDRHMQDAQEKGLDLNPLEPDVEGEQSEVHSSGFHPPQTNTEEAYERKASRRSPVDPVQQTSGFVYDRITDEINDRGRVKSGRNPLASDYVDPTHRQGLEQALQPPLAPSPSQLQRNIESGTAKAIAAPRQKFAQPPSGFQWQLETGFRSALSEALDQLPSSGPGQFREDLEAGVRKALSDAKEKGLNPVEASHVQDELKASLRKALNDAKEKGLNPVEADRIEKKLHSDIEKHLKSSADKGRDVLPESSGGEEISEQPREMPGRAEARDRVANENPSLGLGSILPSMPNLPDRLPVPRQFKGPAERLSKRYAEIDKQEKNGLNRALQKGGATVAEVPGTAAKMIAEPYLNTAKFGLNATWQIAKGAIPELQKVEDAFGRAEADRKGKTVKTDNGEFTLSADGKTVTTPSGATQAAPRTEQQAERMLDGAQGSSFSDRERRAAILMSMSMTRGGQSLLNSPSGKALIGAVLGGDFVDPKEALQIANSQQDLYRKLFDMGDKQRKQLLDGQKDLLDSVVAEYSILDDKGRPSGKSSSPFNTQDALRSWIEALVNKEAPELSRYFPDAFPSKKFVDSDGKARVLYYADYTKLIGAHRQVFIDYFLKPNIKAYKPEGKGFFGQFKSAAEDPRESGADYGELAAYFNPSMVESFNRKSDGFRATFNREHGFKNDDEARAYLRNLRH